MAQKFNYYLYVATDMKEEVKNVLNEGLGVSQQIKEIFKKGIPADKANFVIKLDGLSVMDATRIYYPDNLPCVMFIVKVLKTKDIEKRKNFPADVIEGAIVFEGHGPKRASFLNINYVEQQRDK